MVEYEYFIDTSFLMPFFGLNIRIPTVKVDLENLIRKGTVVAYSIVSITECWFLIIKAIRQGAPKDDVINRYVQAINMLHKNTKLVSVSPTRQDIANLQTKVYSLNHRDYFDQIIIASALSTSKKLITMDTQYTKLIAELKINYANLFTEFEELMTWSDFVAESLYDSV